MIKFYPIEKQNMKYLCRWKLYGNQPEITRSTSSSIPSHLCGQSPFINDSLKQKATKTLGKYLDPFFCIVIALVLLNEKKERNKQTNKWISLSMN